MSFYAALSKWRDENSSERENRALLEEVEKARRIAENPNWEMVWGNVENHAYFKGMVTFFYSPEMTLEEYKNNANRAKTMFDKNGISDIYKKSIFLSELLFPSLILGKISTNYILQKELKRTNF